MTLLCNILNINRRSYYKWLKRCSSNRYKENEILKKTVSKVYHSVNGIYGYRRITMNINSQLKTNYNPKRIYKLMRELKLSSIIRRKKNRYIKSFTEYKAENILNREFYSDKPLQKILTDITEFKYGNSKLYMCATLDLYDKSILSYKLSHTANKELVLETLKSSYRGEFVSYKLLHSDRGSQFTSIEYKNTLEKLGIIHSMSRVGKCIDNGPMEGFFGNIKCEKYYLKKYKDLWELENDIHEYIKFYNNERLQKNLNGLSPLKYREQNNISIKNNVDN